MFFNIDCYILAIYDKKIKVRIVDRDILSKFQTNINNLYKNKKRNDVSITHDSTADIYYLNIQKQTKFIVDKNKYHYNTIKELTGCMVNISGQSKYYSFSVENESLGTESYEKNIKRGYSLICNKISL